MQCVLFICLTVISVAVGFPQRPPFYNVAFPFYSSDQSSRHRGILDESPEADTFGHRNFGRPDFGDFEESSAPVSDMLTQIQELMIRLRQEMNNILTRLPASNEDGALTPFGGDEFSLHDAKNKSTSKTEVIDGQVYRINETVIRTGNDDVGSVVRVKTVQVIPTSLPGLDDDHDESTVKDFTTEESAEIPAVIRKAKNDDNNEIPNEKMSIPYRSAIDSPDNVDQSLNEIQSNAIDVDDDLLNMDQPENPRNLERDLAVNYIAAANRKRGSILMVPTDVEIIGVNEPLQKQYYQYNFGADRAAQYRAESQEASVEPVEESEDIMLRDEDLP